MRRDIFILGIAVVLMVGLIGIVPRVREKGRQEKCMDNLRQIAQAIQFYEDDYDAIMPWAGGWDKGIPSVSWIDLVDPYIKQITPGG